jgi:hypothetical protein
MCELERHAAGKRLMQRLRSGRGVDIDQIYNRSIEQPAGSGNQVLKASGRSVRRHQAKVAVI